MEQSVNNTIENFNGAKSNDFDGKMLNSQRENFLDYAKAIAIFFVVFIHVGFSWLNEIALFSMPIFFMVTGYAFTLGKRSVKQSVIQRFKTVLVPFWAYMALYAVIEILRAYIFGYGTWTILFPSLSNAIYGSGIIPINSQLTMSIKEIMSYKAQVDIGVDVILPSNCHLWFLPAMFVAYVLFVLLVEPTNANHALKGVALLALLFLSSIEVIFPTVCQLPYGFGRGALGAAFMLVGFWLKQYKVFKKPLGFQVVIGIICALLFACALIFGSNGSVLVRSYYGPYGVLSVLLTFVGGLSSAYLVLMLCLGIDKIPLEKIKKFLSFSGRNVMTVYALHMAIKTVFDVFYVCVLSGGKAVLDEYKMGLMPQTAWAYMLFEAVAVIAICLLVARLLIYLKNKKTSNIKNR